jgi:hypothetical protein
MLNIVATTQLARTIASPAPNVAPTAPHLDVVMLLGFMSALFTLVIWPYHKRSRGNRLTFATGLMALSVYSFLAGIWPMGFVAIAWTAATVREAFASKKPTDRPRLVALRRTVEFPAGHWDMESRLFRMFGPNRG